MTNDPTPPEPGVPADAKPALWSRPVVRGAVNGVVFAVLLSAIQVFGVFRPAQPLDDDTLASNMVAGVVFGFAMYIVELWRQRRRASAADVAREVVESRVRDRDGKSGE